MFVWLLRWLGLLGMLGLLGFGQNAIREEHQCCQTYVPELDKSPVLGPVNTYSYQSFTGIVGWW